MILENHTQKSAAIKMSPYMLLLRSKPISNRSIVNLPMAYLRKLAGINPEMNFSITTGPS
jgi:hypothetical protein